MKLGHPRTWLGVLALVGIASFVGSDLLRTAPGPVSASHAALPQLVGMGSCRHCHGGWFGDMRRACTGCHEEIADQVAAKRGLHGTLAAELAGRCGSCHGEHHGEGFAIVNRASFAAAGVADPKHFDHRGIGYAMAGKHLELECRKCHVAVDAPVLARGQHRYLGLSQDCSSCHTDPHQGRMALACAECHGQTDFHRLEPEHHARVLPLEGHHGGLACTSCHAKDSAYALEHVGARRVPGTGRECADCHESPHPQAFVAAVARADRVPAARSCAACHDAHVTFAEADESASAARHSLSGFALAAPHAEVACSGCHGRELGAYAQRFAGRTQDQCGACHTDVHRGEFAGRPLARNGCVDCHQRTAFAPQTFDRARHAETAFPLTGRHGDTACHDCHQPCSDGAPARFVGTPAACAACHPDAHAGFFAAPPGATPPGAAARPTPPGCAECHGTTTFTEIQGGFAHGLRTGFELQAAHQEAACETCHKPRPKPDHAGRRFGTVRESFGTVTGCATCHEDPHAGAFDRSGLPRRVAGRSDCARCHLETSFRAMERFDHGAWTGFTLIGAHRKAECSSCHVGETGAKRRFPVAKGTQCAACHEDPHGGQFTRAGSAADCARCHVTGESFRELAFRHDLHSRFALGTQHGSLACAACHQPFEAEGHRLVRYRPLPVLCVDCHGQPNSPFRARKESGR